MSCGLIFVSASGAEEVTSSEYVIFYECSYRSFGRYIGIVEPITGFQRRWVDRFWCGDWRVGHFAYCAN